MAAGWSPVPPTGRRSAVALPRWWHVACFSRELRRAPLARTVVGAPLVLFRDAGGRAVALLDRCPHRNVPLSAGRRCDGGLECAYHGWRFDGEGRCVAVPGLAGVGADHGADRPARRVPAFPVAERDGLVWVVPSLEPPVQAEPPALPHVDEPGYGTVRHRGSMPATLVDALENTLDVPHTAFLHRGLFRGGRAPVPVEVRVESRPDGVEAHYEGEPVPTGLAARLLRVGEGTVTHVDRFLLPSLAQVEYRLGPHHLVITTAYTPVHETETALHATVTFRAGLPPAVLRAVVTPLARRILAQDAAILRLQRDNVARFGGEHYATTPIDVLGPHIVRRLRQAARAGAAAGTDPSDEADPGPGPPPVERATLLL